MRPNIIKYLNVKLWLPLLEVAVEDSAWKSLPTDPDALQHAVAAELVDNQVVFHLTYDEGNNLFISCFYNTVLCDKERTYLEFWSHLVSSSAQSEDEWFSD